MTKKNVINEVVTITVTINIHIRTFMNVGMAGSTKMGALAPKGTTDGANVYGRARVTDGCKAIVAKVRRGLFPTF